MTLENIAEDKVQLESVFGWEGLTLQAKNKHSKHSTTFTDEEEVYLKDLNKYDEELYTFTRSLAQERTQKIKASMGPA